MAKESLYATLATPAADDLVPIIDVNDFTMASSGTTKKILVADLFDYPVVNPGDGVMRLLIPMYIYPSYFDEGGGAWQQVQSACPAASIVIANVASGPGTSVNDDFTAQIPLAQAAGLTVLGYVPTNYGATSAATVEGQVDDWYDFYGVDGIFFDEAATSTEDQPYYQQIYDYVKAKPAAGRMVVINPGSPTDVSYMTACDIVCDFEDDANTFLTEFTAEAWAADYPADRFCRTINQINDGATLGAIIAALRAQRSGYCFVTTNDAYSSLPADPWWTGQLWQASSLTSYPVAGAEGSTAQSLTNGSTVTITGLGVARVTSSAAVTGIIMPAGTAAAQQVTVVNEGSYPVSFAAAGTSAVADGISDVIAPATSSCYTWDSGTSLWYGGVSSAVVVGLPPSGDGTGATDPVNIQALLNLGGKAALQSGTFYMGGSSALALGTAGGVLAGSGLGTKLEITSGFSGTEVVSIAAPNCTVSGLSIVGASSTIASNPAANGIEVQPGSYQTTVQNILMQYVNGYGVEGTNLSGHADISHSFYDKLAIYNCAGGIHFNGAQMTVGTVLSNIEIGNIGTGTGANANLDGLLIEDAFDITATNVNVGTGNLGTGHGLRIHGNCQNIWFDIMDCGGYPEPLAATQCGLLVETGTNGSPSGVWIDHAVFQTWGQGGQVSGSAQNINLSHIWWNNNVTHGLTLSGTGSQVNVTDCTFEANGSGASGTNYDLNISGTPDGNVRDCHFLTSVVAVSSAGVQNVVFSAGGNMYFEDDEFLGTGSGLSTIFSGLPAHVRNCKNYNPHGSATVSVPASGSPCSALHYDAWFYITAANASGQLLCAPAQYAPGSQTLLATPTATTVASGSNGGEISTIASWGGTYGGNGVLDVASTTGYPTAGTLTVATSTTTATITYTGTSGGNSFTGCAYVSGSATGTVSTGGAVNLISFMPVSSGNASTGSFTAPASGSVVVTASCVWQTSSSSDAAAFGLAAHGTITPLVAYTFAAKASTTQPLLSTFEFIATGLTAGNSYNFDLMFAAASGGVATVYATGNTSTAPNPGNSSLGFPVTMTVTSAPADNSGGCTIVRNTNGIGGGVGPTVTIPAGACVPVFVPAQQTITPTYTDAPAWVVDGL